MSGAGSPSKFVQTLLLSGGQKLGIFSRPTVEKLKHFEQRTKLRQLCAVATGARPADKIVLEYAELLINDALDVIDFVYEKRTLIPTIDAPKEIKYDIIRRIVKAAVRLSLYREVDEICDRQREELGIADWARLKALAYYAYDPEKAIWHYECARSESKYIEEEDITRLAQLYLETNQFEKAIRTSARIADNDKKGEYCFFLQNADRQMCSAPAQRFIEYFRSHRMDAVLLSEKAQPIAMGDRRRARETAEGPLVSVIVPVFNARETLETAVGSLRSQTYENLEILIFDDMSTDGSLAYLTEIAKSDPRISVFTNPHNVGPYVSKNIGMRIARGDYITFADGDDFNHPQRIAIHLQHMNEKPDKIVSFSKWVRMTDDGEILIQRWGPALYSHRNNSSLFLKKSALDEIGYFDCARADADFELNKRIDFLYGRSKTIQIPLVLSIAGVKSNSLTMGTELGLNAERFSQPRLDYKKSILRRYLERGIVDVGIQFPDTTDFCEKPKEMRVDRANLEVVISSHRARFRDR